MKECPHVHDETPTNKTHVRMRDFQVEISTCAYCGEEVSRKLICEEKVWTGTKGSGIITKGRKE